MILFDLQGFEVIANKLVACFAVSLGLEYCAEIIIFKELTKFLTSKHLKLGLKIEPGKSVFCEVLINFFNIQQFIGFCVSYLKKDVLFSVLLAFAFGYYLK